MKELISAVLLVVSLYGGTVALRKFHDTLKKAAIEKAAQGLPSLREMNGSLHRENKKMATELLSDLNCFFE